MGSTRALSAWCAGLGLLASGPLVALTLAIDAAVVTGWVDLEQAKLQLEITDDGQGWLRLSAQELLLKSAQGPVRLLGVEARCRSRIPSAALATLNCDRGRLTWRAGPDSDERLGVNFELQTTRGGQTLQLSLIEEALSLTHLQRWLSSGPVPALLGDRWPEQLSGTAHLDLKLKADSLGLRELQGEVTLNELGFTAKDAAEAARIQLQFRGERGAPDWSGSLGFQHTQGALFIVPGFNTASGAEPGWLLDAQDGVFDTRLRWTWSAASGSLALPELALLGPELNLQAAGIVFNFLQPMALQEGHFELEEGELGSLYRRYLQPALLGGPAGDLELSGRAALQVDWKAGALAQGDVRFKDVAAVDTRQRYAVDGLNGALALGTATTPHDFTLGFERASLYRLPIGATQFKLATTPNGLQLREPAVLPILDGEFQLASLNIEPNDDGGGHTLALNGVLAPISLPVLAAQLGWPSAAGKLSGIIPSIRWSAHQIAVDGDLLVKIFDGRVIARDLLVREPLGTLPELSTDLELHDLDLELATKETGFGLIQGSLSGRIDDLRLQAWQPLAMDLSIGTPEDDSRPHRISQRAVNSLSALAGGGPNLLSRGLMRLFSTYSYGRMGVGCRLENGICTLHGAAERSDGALILVSRGGLIPPYIEVRASGERLAWTRLTDIFQRIRSGELVIE